MSLPLNPQDTATDERVEVNSTDSPNNFIRASTSAFSPVVQHVQHQTGKNANESHSETMTRRSTSSSSRRRPLTPNDAPITNDHSGSPPALVLPPLAVNESHPRRNTGYTNRQEGRSIESTFDDENDDEFFLQPPTPNPPHDCFHLPNAVISHETVYRHHNGRRTMSPRTSIIPPSLPYAPDSASWDETNLPTHVRGRGFRLMPRTRRFTY